MFAILAVIFMFFGWTFCYVALPVGIVGAIVTAVQGATAIKVVLTLIGFTCGSLLVGLVLLAFAFICAAITNN